MVCLPDRCLLSFHFRTWRRRRAAAAAPPSWTPPCRNDRQPDLQRPIYEPIVICFSYWGIYLSGCYVVANAYRPILQPTGGLLQASSFVKRWKYEGGQGGGRSGRHDTLLIRWSFAEFILRAGEPLWVKKSRLSDIEWVFLKKMGHYRPLCLYFRLFNTVDSKCSI